jgi:hypothetical protein
VVAFVFAPACCGKTTFAAKSPRFIDIDVLYEPEKRILEAMRKDAYENNDWIRHNRWMNATVFNSFYKRGLYGQSHYVVLCHHPDQMKGFYPYDADTATKEIVILNRDVATSRLNSAGADDFRKRMATLNTRELLLLSRRSDYTVVHDFSFERYDGMIEANYESSSDEDEHRDKRACFFEDADASDFAFRDEDQKHMDALDEAFDEGEDVYSDFYQKMH